MSNKLYLVFSQFLSRYQKIYGLLLMLFCIFCSNISLAQEGYVTHEGYACPGMNLLKERYQGDCFPCEIVNVLLASFMRASSRVYDVSREAGNKLLLLGSAIWLAFWALRKLSSFANIEPSSMTNELIVFFGKVLIAYCFINAGIGSLVNFAINPILGAGAEFGSALLLETEDIKLSTAPKPENQYTGPTDIVSKSVMDKILKLSEGVSNEVATNFIIGSGLTCFSIQKGLHIEVPLIIDIHIPDIWLWLCGAAIWCVGFMLVLAVCYYLIDIPFKIGFAIMALPVVIGLWPFKVTAGKLKSIIGIALNAAFTFLFLALSSSYAIRLMSQAFNAEGSLDYKGQSYSGKEALFKAFEVDDEEYVQSLFDFTGPAFLIILFCYIYGFKMISSITNDYPNKFDSGMTSAAGSPLHHMATAATAWVGNKVAAPFKKGLDIVTHQAGMAATTVTKAAANVGLGAAGAVVGAGTKAMGRRISKVSSRWVDSQKNAKAAADSLDEYNQMHQAGLGTKLQGKMGKVGAAIGLGLANSVNKLGRGMENGGNAMMAPGKNTLNRVVAASKLGGSEIVEAGAELGGALAETMAAITPKALAEKMQQSQRFGSLGNKIIQTKSEIKNQAHQSFDTSVEKFANSGKTLVQNAINTGQSIASGAVNGRQRLASAFSSIKNSAQNISAESIKDKMIKTIKSPIKYIASGAVKMHHQIQHDVKVSKEHARSFGEIGENMAYNFGMVGADFAEAGHSFMHGNMKRNWQELQKTVSDFKSEITKDTGIKNPFGEAMVTMTGIGIGIAAARHLARNAAEGAEYVGDGHIDDVASAIGTGVVRPSIALGMTIAKTASNTFDSAYNLAGGTLLTGIDVARTVLAPVGNAMRATANVGYAFGDTGLALAAGVGDTLGVVGSHLNVAYQYTKYVTKPTSALLIGVPRAIIGRPLGFAAKAVDNTLYGGFKAAATVGSGAMQVGNVVGRGANVLYHGIKDRTIAGQVAAKTLKSGSKTLKLAAKTLNLGRNIVLAAAGEKFNEVNDRDITRTVRNKQYLERKEQERKEQKKQEQERQEQERKEQERKEQEEKEHERKEQERKERERKEKEEKEEKERKDRLLEEIGRFDITFGNSDNDWYFVGLASKATQIKTADNKFIKEASNRIAEIPPKIFEDKVYGYYDLIDKGEIGLHEALRVKKFAQDYLAQNMDPDQYNELIQETNRFILQSRKDLNMGVIFEKEGKEVLICKDHDIVDNYTPSEFTSQLGIENLVGLDIQITDKDKNQVSRFKFTDDMGGCELTISPKDSKSIDDTIIYSYHDGNYYKSVNYIYDEIVPKGSSEYDLVKSEIENAQHEAIDVFSEFKIGMHDKAIVDSIWGSHGVEEFHKLNQRQDQRRKEYQEKDYQRRKKHQETIDRIRNGEHVDIEKEYQEEFQQNMEDIATTIEKINKFN